MTRLLPMSSLFSGDPSCPLPSDNFLGNSNIYGCKSFAMTTRSLKLFSNLRYAKIMGHREAMSRLS